MGMLALVLALAFVCTKCQQAEVAEKDSIVLQSGLKNLHEFLEDKFDAKVLKFDLNEVSKPGDSHNSKVWGLQVELVKNNKDGIMTVRTEQLVLKAMRSNPPNARQLLQFMNELHFYSDIIQAIEQFQVIVHMPNEEKIDAFVRYFGSRFSLNADNKIPDADAILLLENAKASNFISPNRWNYFDRDEVLACLTQMAKLHASCIAMRRLQPALYHSQVEPHLHTNYNDSHIDHLIRVTEDFYNENFVSTFPHVSTNLRSAIQKQLEISKHFLINNDRVPDTPYTTFYHRDLWIKNIMIRRDGADGKSIKVKIMDFQVYDYNSFALDLLHFLLINARIDDLKTDFSPFIDHYLLEFVNVLRLADCPLDDYTHEKLWTEIKKMAKLNLFTIYMYLALRKVQIEELNGSIQPQTTDESTNHQHSTQQVVFNRWKCINDLYLENGFISIE